MTVTPRSGYHNAGLASQGAQNILAPPEAVLTGDYPPLSGIDYEVAAGVDLAALTVVGFDRYGRLVPATYGPPGAFASGKLTIGGARADGQTVTIDGVIYRFSTNVNADGRVAVGDAANVALAARNLIDAINDSRIFEGGVGYQVASAHPTVAASSGGAGIVVIQAKQPGAQGNAIATAEAMTNGAWAAAVLTGGIGNIRPVGVLPYAVKTAAGETPMTPVHPTGVFNPDRLVWHESFGTEAKRRMAFFDSPAPTNIMIRKIRANTV